MSLFPKTHIYTVHINPSQTQAVEKAVFVREGFNLMAFIFGALWALYHRMGWETAFIAIVVALFMVAGKQQLLDEISLNILKMVFYFIIGLQANDLRRNALSRKGYIMSEVVVSDNELRAQQRYFDRVLPA